MKKIKLETDINFCGDGITLTQGKAGETYDIPDDLAISIELLNKPGAKKKSDAPENKGIRMRK